MYSAKEDVIIEGLIINRIMQQLTRRLPVFYQLMVKKTALDMSGEIVETDLMIIHKERLRPLFENSPLIVPPDVIIVMEKPKQLVRKLQKFGVGKVINLLPEKRSVLIIEKGVWSIQPWTEAITTIAGVKVKLPLLDTGTLEDLLI